MEFTIIDRLGKVFRIITFELIFTRFHFPFINVSLELCKKRRKRIFQISQTKVNKREFFSEFLKAQPDSKHF